MTIESRRSTVHSTEVSTSSTSSTSSISSTSSTTKQPRIARRKSIFAKLVKRSSVEPTFVAAHSDLPLSTLCSPTRQVHSMDGNAFRNSIKSDGNSSGKGNDNDNDNDDLKDGEFRPPPFLIEHLERERADREAAQKRRHSVCASSQRLHAQRMLEKMEKIRAFDDLIQSGKTITIKMSLTPELAV